MFHLTPNWAALQVQRTPFQKGEAPITGQQKNIWVVIIFVINYLFPNHIIIQMISINPGG